MLLRIILLASIATNCTSGCAARPAVRQIKEPSVEKPIDTKGQPLPDHRDGGQSSEDQPKKQSIWTQGVLGAIVSLLGALGSLVYFCKTSRLSRHNADRTVTFEAQKLLVEINKQFIADPSLFAIYDDNPENKKALERYPKLKAKVEALGYMKLNVYEIVFAKLPDDSREGSWKGYFLDSLDRCSVLAEELEVSQPIYHPNLIHAYKEWAKDGEGKKFRAAERKRRNIESKTAWLDPTGSGPA
jgi:hypothetical protein